MNEMIILNQKERKEVVEKFLKEQEEIDRFYEDVVKNLNTFLNKKKEKKQD